MQAEEACESGAADILPATKEDQRRMSDDWNAPRDFRSHFRGEKRQRVPGQQIAAEAESQTKEKQDHAAHPRQLAWFAIRTQKRHAKHVSESYKNHQVG